MSDQKLHATVWELAGLFQTGVQVFATPELPGLTALEPGSDHPRHIGVRVQGIEL